MRVLLAFNPFKGTLSAAQATAAAVRGLRRSHRSLRLDSLAAADGGPGTLQAVQASAGGRLRRLRVPGPLGRPVDAAWLDLGPDALVESAQAVGLHRVPKARRDALAADSEGLGRLLLHLARLGKRRVLVGLGGSACTDGGHGLALALGWRFENKAGEALPPGGGGLIHLHRLRSPGGPALGRLQVRALCDVTAPLLGPRGAARVYAPQKGATPSQVLRLEAGLRRLARLSSASLARVPGAGAAGGLGFGLLAFAGATPAPGAATLLKLAGLEPRLRRADWVLTGEGCLDRQTLQGKLPAVVAAKARRLGKPCVALCGQVSLKPAAWKRAGFSGVLAAPARSPKAAARALEQAAFQWAKNL